MFFSYHANHLHIRTVMIQSRNTTILSAQTIPDGPKSSGEKQTNTSVAIFIMGVDSDVREPIQQENRGLWADTIS